MLRIRFFRTGKKNQPFFKIVVTDKRNAPKGGRFVEAVGFFNPFNKEKKLKEERIKHWLKAGAQPSDRVHNLLVAEGIIKEKKRPVHAKAKKKEVSAESARKPEAEKKEAPAEKKEEQKEPAKQVEAEKPDTEKKTE